MGFRKSEALHRVTFGMIEKMTRCLIWRKLRIEQQLKKTSKSGVCWRKYLGGQKSREWLKEGDRNTGFFNVMDNSHRKRNIMGKIKIEGRWVEEESKICKGIAKAFYRP